MKNIILTAIGLTSITALCVSGYVFYSTPKTAYIELPIVFENFEMKKELEKELQTITTAKQNQLDSLKFELQLEVRPLQQNGRDAEEFQLKNRAYLIKEEQTQQNIEILSEEYNNRIWKQLNQYIADYGKEKGLTFLYGASGSGAVMYADETNNITKEVTAFVNTKYSGKAITQ